MAFQKKRWRSIIRGWIWFKKLPIEIVQAGNQSIRKQDLEHDARKIRKMDGKDCMWVCICRQTCSIYIVIQEVWNSMAHVLLHRRWCSFPFVSYAQVDWIAVTTCTKFPISSQSFPCLFSRFSFHVRLRYIHASRLKGIKYKRESEGGKG